MKVLYDHQIFQMQNYGGISRYFFELMDNSKFANFDFELSLTCSANDYLRGVSNKTSFSINPSLQSRLFRITNHLNRYQSQHKIQKGNFDVFHPTFFETYFLESLKRPYVLTVYDLINELFPQYFGNNNAFIEKRRVLIRNAKKIISISENTKTDIIKFYGTDPAKIEVTYLGESLSNLVSEKIETLPARYILFVGKRDSYKNFELAYRAIREVLADDKSLNLICAGGNPFNQTEIEMFSHDQTLAQVKFIRFSGDQQLKFIYENALCFLFPSLYEGFGIPVLEAFASQCTVCLSNSSSLREIGQGSAIFFDPQSKSEIKNAVLKALAMNPRNDLTDKALIELKKFSWVKTAQDTLKVYNLC